MTDTNRNTNINTYEMILGVLTMVVIGKLTAMLPSHMLEYALVAALPFHLIGLWLVIKSGIEPTAYLLAEQFSKDEEDY